MWTIPEEIAGPNGGLVYIAEIVGVTSGFHPAVTPYWRDDACLDDGTGDFPVPRPWPGESGDDNRVMQGYVDYWLARGMPNLGTLAANYAQLKCQPAKLNDPGTPAWQQMPFQGAIGQHGIHYAITGDSDNLFTPTNTDEIDAQQWRFAVPMSQPTNVLEPYGNNVTAKLAAAVLPYGQTTPAPSVPEVPAPALLLLVGIPAVLARAASARRALA